MKAHVLMEALKRGKVLISFLICYAIFVYFWTKLMQPQVEESDEPKVEENRIAPQVNATDDPFKKYQEDRAKVLQRTDLPWLRVQQNIPHINIPLFDTLRENCKTVANRRTDPSLRIQETMPRISSPFFNTLEENGKFIGSRDSEQSIFLS